jgi:preprotein translocase subunit SecE
VLTREPGRDFRPIRFIRDVIGELRKVSWPTRDEAFRLTGIVLVIAGIIGVILGVLDFGFSKLMGAIFSL